MGWGASHFLGLIRFCVSRLVRVLRWRAAIRACRVCESACIDPGPVFEDPRAADAALRGASGRGHHDGRDTGFGVPPPGGCGVFAEFDGRGGGRRCSAGTSGHAAWTTSRQWEIDRSTASEFRCSRATAASRRHRRLARRRMPPRKHAVSGLPRTEGLSRCGGLTKKHETQPTLLSLSK